MKLTEQPNIISFAFGKVLQEAMNGGNKDISNVLDQMSHMPYKIR